MDIADKKLVAKQGYNILGDDSLLAYGFDPIGEVTKKRVLNFAFGGQQITWNNRAVYIPQNVKISQSPTASFREKTVKHEFKTARDYQRSLKSKLVAAPALDEENDMSFSITAKYVNKLIDNSSKKYVSSFTENIYDYSFFKIEGIGYSRCIKDSVKTAVKDCGTNREKIMEFYQDYGTYILASAGIGGSLKIQTTIHIDREAEKQLDKSKIDLAQVIAEEDNEIINGKLAFDQRSKNDENIFTKSTIKNVDISGGKINAKDFDEWTASLSSSDIISMRKGEKEDPNEGVKLAFINKQYLPIYEIFDLGDCAKKVWQEVHGEYFEGQNPFNNTPPRFSPPYISKNKKISAGKSIRFDMGGWFRTYTTRVGLKAVPGAVATVKCKSDAESGGWTKVYVHAGDQVVMREKVPYLSRYMDVVFESCTGDEGAVLYVENEFCG